MRIIYDVIAFLAVLYAPFWVIVGICIWAMYSIPRWYEVIIVFGIFDLLFHAPLPSTMIVESTRTPLVFYATIALILFEWMRGNIRERIS